jgi:hypothetical protein
MKLFPISGSTLLIPLSTDKSKDRREQVGSLRNNMEYTLYPTKLFQEQNNVVFSLCCRSWEGKITEQVTEK